MASRQLRCHGIRKCSYHDVGCTTTATYTTGGKHKTTHTVAVVDSLATEETEKPDTAVIDGVEYKRSE